MFGRTARRAADARVGSASRRPRRREPRRVLRGVLRAAAPAPLPDAARRRLGVGAARRRGGAARRRPRERRVLPLRENRARALATDPSGDAFIKAGRSRRGPAAVAAFGPAAGTFAENLSVFSAAVPGASLAALGASPAAAAQRLLDVSIAPPSSGKTALLLAASARPDGLFAFEYTLALPTRRDGAPGAVLHNLAVAAARPDELLTCTILCKEDDWPDREAAFREAAASFILTR